MLMAAMAVCANAQKVMRIHHTDGTSTTHAVGDVVKITFEEAGQEDPEGPLMVDMGVSVLWASYNVGATKPSEYGNFYAYGETEPKSEYTFENYLWRYPDYNDWDCDEWEKYFKLGATITGTNYDVAHVKWGGDWRIPTQDEWEELINNSNCQWTAINGVNGVKMTSRITGNSIFLPAAGNMVDADHTHDQLGCFYWTSTEWDGDMTIECRNYRANLDATNHSAQGYDYPEVGFSIRAVSGPVPDVVETVSVPADNEMVDLGLSVKWAPYNLGASQSHGIGKFYCWGETSSKLYTHLYNYKYYDPLTDDYMDIGTDICGTEYDCAAMLWGNDWRLPTKEEMQELIDMCTWTAESGGFTVTGPNGNSIYLPAAGMMTYKGAPRTSYESFYYMSGTAEIWKNSQGETVKGNCAGFRVYRDSRTKLLGDPKVGINPMCGGISVRPVHP